MDGSVLIGEILGMKDGNLTLKTSFAGKVKIPHPSISSISSPNSFSIRLDDDRVFDGVMVAKEEKKFGLEGLSNVFEFSRIRHLWVSEENDPLIMVSQKKAEMLLLKWNHSVGFDLSGSSGNTEDFGVGIRLDSSLGNRSREYDLYLAYNYSTKKNSTTVDETKLGAEYDSRFFDELAWYVKTDLENDRLEEIDLRATAALGLKYSWIDNASYKLSLRAGAASRFEKIRSRSKDFAEPALDFGLEYSHQFKKSISLVSDLTYVPALSNFSDFLLSQDSALVIRPTQSKDWNLRSGVDGTYNTTPALNKEELDFKYYFRVVYLFN